MKYLRTELSTTLVVSDFDNRDGIPRFLHRVADKLHRFRDKIEPSIFMSISLKDKDNRDWGHFGSQTIRRKNLWPRKNSAKATLRGSLNTLWEKRLGAISRDHGWGFTGVDAQLAWALAEFGYPTNIGITFSVADIDGDVAPRPLPKRKTVWDHILL